MGAMTADDYLAQLQSLLPQGAAWPRGSDAVLSRLLLAWADGFARFEEQAEVLLREIDPRTSVVLLSDWENVAGLPDPCVIEAGQVQSLEQRQAALYGKETGQAVISRQDFIDLAAAYGYPGATITEYKPFTCNSNCNDGLWTTNDRFAWQINLPSTGGTYLFTCNSNCDDALASWGNAALECRIKQLAHGEMTVAFAYIN